MSRRYITGGTFSIFLIVIYFYLNFSSLRASTIALNLNACLDDM